MFERLKIFLLLGAVILPLACSLGGEDRQELLIPVAYYSTEEIEFEQIEVRKIDRQRIEAVIDLNLKITAFVTFNLLIDYRGQPSEGNLTGEFLKWGKRRFVAILSVQDVHRVESLEILLYAVKEIK